MFIFPEEIKQQRKKKKGPKKEERKTCWGLMSLIRRTIT
jgi:hypothetical protein